MHSDENAEEISLDHRVPIWNVLIVPSPYCPSFHMCFDLFVWKNVRKYTNRVNSFLELMSALF